MHRLFLVIIILLCAPAAFAQQTLHCLECREVSEHPMDYGNYAFNEIIAPIPDTDFSPFTVYSETARVWSKDYRWAIVGLRSVTEDTGINIFGSPIGFSIRLATGFTEITVQDQYGNTMSYEVFEQSMPLSVGNESGSPPAAVEETTETPTVTEKADSHGGGQEIICCQEGAYYWYADQIGFSMQLGNE